MQSVSPRFFLFKEGRSHMWYVMQVRTGNEFYMKQQCERMISPEAAEKIFIPLTERKVQRNHEWRLEKFPLFAGYVFVISEQIDLFHTEMRRLFGFKRLLGADGEIVPLTTAEVTFMEGFGGKEQIVGMSEGFIENDKVVITSGPLVGREGLIRKIDRHKRKAFIEIEMFGRPQKVEMGVEILWKR